MLSTLIECYNEDAVLNKNLKAQNMLSFIDERLITVEEELHDAENIVERYKRENDLSDIDAEAKSFLKQTVNIASYCWKPKHNIRLFRW